MTKSLGKRPRKQTIKCWGCEGDHMYKYFPHWGDKMNILHSVKKEETIENVGKRIPRIYAGLDNRQEDYQSHMIEVEGKIDNHPIAILTDYNSLKILLCKGPHTLTHYCTRVHVG
jgi:hypothetical protein